MTKKILGLSMVVAMLSMVSIPAFATITIPETIVTAVSIPTYTSTQALELIPTIITWAFGFLLAIVVLMLIASAYLFVTGGGNPDQIGQARKMLMFALIGLAVALVARGLIYIMIEILGV
jgi:hypothetical protein